MSALDEGVPFAWVTLDETYEFLCENVVKAKDRVVRGIDWKCLSAGCHNSVILLILLAVKVPPQDLQWSVSLISTRLIGSSLDPAHSLTCTNNKLIWTPSGDLVTFYSRLRMHRWRKMPEDLLGDLTHVHLTTCQIRNQEQTSLCYRSSCAFEVFYMDLHWVRGEPFPANESVTAHGEDEYFQA